MHEITVKNKEADTRRAEQRETHRANRAKEKFNVGKWDDERLIETVKAIFGKGGLTGAASSGLAAFNDVAWYNKVPQLLETSAKWPGYTPSDTFIHNRQALYGSMGEDSYQFESTKVFTTIPSILVLNYIPTIGSYSGAVSSGASNAARRLYNIIRQANSAAAAYDPGELMKIIIAVGSVYCELINLKRALQSINKDDEYSRALSKLIVNACGFNYDDLSSRRESYRGYYNAMCHLLYPFKIPTKLTIFMRWAWMNSLLIKDADKNDNCQRYMFRPVVRYVYNDATGDLKAHRVSTYANLEAFKSDIDSMYYGIFNSSAAVTIFRDIQKAVDQGRLDANDLVYLGPISEEIYNAPFAEQFNPEVVNQIHNATLCGEIKTIADFDIRSTQDGAISLSALEPDFQSFITAEQGQHVTSFAPGIIVQGQNNIVSLLDNDSSPERITVATRLKVAGEISGDATNGVEYTAEYFATEVITTAEIVTFERGGTQKDIDPSNIVMHIHLAMNTLLMPNQTPYVQLYAQFDGAPNVHFVVYDPEDTGTPARNIDAWRMHKVIYVTDSTLEQRLHEACVLSELSYL